MELKDLGRLVATRSISGIMDKDKDFKEFVNLSIGRYLREDWGDLTADDKKLNDDAIKSGQERILAAYKIPAGYAKMLIDNNDDTLWIITEWDRSVTTILFPSEY